MTSELTLAGYTIKIHPCRDTVRNLVVTGKTPLGEHINYSGYFRTICSTSLQIIPETKKGIYHVMMGFDGATHSFQFLLDKDSVSKDILKGLRKFFHHFTPQQMTPNGAGAE
jgi:hypothetical protein